jgi:hypothetical protein
MATEFNPGGKIQQDKAARGSINPPTTVIHHGRHWSTFVILGLLAIVLVTGIVLTVRDSFDTASETSSGATTGMSGASPSNPPPAPGPAGQGESNSTR